MKKKAFLLIGMGFEAWILLWFFVPYAQKWDRDFNTSGWITAGVVVLILLLWFFQLIGLFKPSPSQENFKK